MDDCSLPSRKELLEKLRRNRFDLFIIGGGATGVGIALDAVSRGYSVALVERGDFSSATSSRSTKLIHGGVRYLEQAIKSFDFSKLFLVKEALQERYILRQLAPHLVWKLPLLLPIYSWFKLPYYWLGMKAYDFLAGRYSLGMSRFISTEEVLSYFPTLKKEKLKGGIIFWDGQFDDARLNLSLAQSAIARGGVLLNYVEVCSIERVEEKISSLELHDKLSGEQWKVDVPLVVNAAGPFSDQLRKMEDREAEPMISPSMGSHLVFSEKFPLREMGLLIPKSCDGRLFFLLPWKGALMAGTTDHPTKLSFSPKPTEEEVKEIFNGINPYFNQKFSKNDLLAAWSGIRPLVKGKGGDLSTKDLSREHVIERLSSRFYTIAGGKWTTYRKMAEDLIDRLVADGVLSQRAVCRSRELKLFSSSSLDKLEGKLDRDIEKHLLESYGKRASEVESLALKGYSKRLAEGYPYIEAEIFYAIDYEYACRVSDVLFRRLRVGFLDEKAIGLLLPSVVELMKDRLSWDRLRVEQEIAAVENEIFSIKK